jgi:phosphatidylethanolamine-binding protein (PEBP) family uncharacterized protein
MTAGVGGTGGSAGKAAAGQGGTGGSGGSGGSAGANAGGGQSAAGTGGAAGARAGGAGAGSGGRAGGAGTGAGSAGLGGTTGGMSGSGSGGASGSGGSGGMGGAAAGSGGAGGGSTFTLTSPGFTNMAGCSETMQAVCDTFPPELVSFSNNDNVSPELDWTPAPAGTQTFAVVLQDLSNKNAHWVLWNIPGTATNLPSGVDQSTNMPPVPPGSQQTNNFGAGDGYFGPGSACNVYEFVVYALSVPTFAPSPVTDANVVRTQLLALGDSILASASLRGRPNICSGTQMCNANNMCAN